MCLGYMKLKMLRKQDLSVWINCIIFCVSIQQYYYLGQLDEFDNA